jgi:hypothetical protein
MSKESVFSIKNFLSFGWDCVSKKLIELVGLMILAGVL